MTDAPADSSAKQANEKLEDFFNHHYRSIVSFFIRAGAPIETSRDLAQDTVLRMHRSGVLLRAESESGLRGFAFEVARNVLKNWYRGQSALKKQGIEVALDLSEGELHHIDIADDEPSPLDRALSKENSTLVRESLDALPTNRRLAMQLRLQGLQYVEIAENMGISIETVKSHIYQARESLKKSLAAQAIVGTDSAAPGSREKGEGEASLSVAKAPNSNRHRAPSERERKILDLYRTHGSMRKVAEELGLSAMWVSKVLKSIPEETKKEAGVKVREPGYARPWKPDG